jgi:hypothetical protein
VAPTDIKVEWRFAGHDDRMTIDGIDGARRATPYIYSSSGRNSKDGSD